MTELALLVAKYGFLAVAGIVLLYLILNGEVEFKYPRRANRRNSKRNR